jgi:membrane-bound serine protease (ClpP class)
MIAVARAFVAIALCVLPAAVSASRVDLVHVDGSINPAVDDFLRESLAAAHADGAAALVIQLDTPGGLLTSTKSIVKELLGAPLPVIVYVAPSGASATSAGVFITMAAHVAAMAPGTTIGAAHPVGSGGQDVGGDMREKVENFTVSFVRSIAERRGRNVKWAEQAVRESLSITEKEALEKKVIDLVAPDLATLLTRVAGREVQVGSEKVALDVSAESEIVVREMRLSQRILDAIADPNIAYLLLMAGLLGLYFEFAHPGAVFPGVMGGICLLLALAALQVLPINSTGLLLLLLGVALLVAEVFVASFGILGIGGLIAFVLGSLFLFDGSDPTLAVDRSLIAAVAFCAGAFILGVGYLVIRTQRRRSVTGREGLIGETGVVRERIGDVGKVFVHGEYWNAVSDAPLEVGERVEVLAVEPGMRLRVRRRPA